MKKREVESRLVQLSTFCRQLKMESSDGKKYLTEVADTEGLFRIIQSIPSPSAGWPRSAMTGARLYGCGFDVIIELETMNSN